MSNAYPRRFVLLCLLPGLLTLFALMIVPTLDAINLAFHDRSLQYADAPFIGLDNFRDMLGDRRLLNALKISALWELITVAGTLLTAMLVAIVLFENLSPAKRNLVAMAFVVPVLLPRVSAGLVWRFLYSPLLGVVNFAITSLGAKPVEFLTDPRIALFAVALVDIWQWGLFFSVIVLKLIETLPTSPFEAARLDHAKTWQVHWFLTLPLLRLPLVTLAFVKAVESLRSFDLIYTMTGGGPGIATETLDLYAYQQGIGVGGRVSYAAAMSVLLMLITTVLFSVLWKRMQRWAD